MPAAWVGPGCREKRVNLRRDRWLHGPDSESPTGKAGRHSRSTVAGLGEKRRLFFLYSPTYDLIFSGMNLHHGTPEEVCYLATQLWNRLRPGGLFISHDTFRPDDTPYAPRPRIIDGETSALVSRSVLDAANLPDLEIIAETGGNTPYWRADYVDRMQRALLAKKAELAGVESSIAHMRSRDFPISMAELKAIMYAQGFDLLIKRYDNTDEPMGPYVALCIASKPHSV